MSAVPGVNSVTLSWTNPQDPEPEGVYVEVMGEQSRVIALPGAPETTVVSGLRNGVTYSFRVTAATRHGSAAASETVETTPTTGVEGVVAGLIVEFAPGVDDAVGTQEVPGEQVLPVDVAIAADVTDSAVLVELAEPVSVDEAEAIAASLEAHPQVEWAEPDQFLFTSSTAIDASAGKWNLSGTYGVDAGQGTDAASAGDGVTVAVIDTGITSHPQLDSRIVAGFDFVSSPDQLSAVRQANAPPVAFDGDYVDEGAYGVIGRDSNPADPGDWNTAHTSSWHGTKMAGLIADVAPGASIQPIRALSWRGGLLSDIATSIAWASGTSVDGTPVNANPATVINMSFSVEAICPIALQDAINSARERGSILVAAAGNAGDDASRYAPGNCNGVITVGATTSEGVRAAYSNYGAVVDISAPGGDNAAPVVSASNDGTQAPGTASTAGDFGTSVSAAHVSAAAAVLAAQTPSVTPDAAYRTLTGRDHVKDFANPTCDANPDFSCGAGISTLGGPLAQIAAAGDTDTYVTLNGTNQRAIGASGFYPVQGGAGQSFTVSAWVYDNDLNSGSYRYVAAQQAASSSEAFYLGTRGGSQEIHLPAWDTGILLPVQQWVHLAVVRSGANATLYVNGAVAAVRSNYDSGVNISGSQPFRVGSFVDDRANEFWNGHLDQIKVYTSALSSSQVLSDMESYGAPTGVASLVAMYDFNDVSGATIVNRGTLGSSGNLTMANSPTYTDVASSSTSGTTTTVTFRRSYLTANGGWIAPTGVSTSTALLVGGGGGGGHDGGGAGGGGGYYQGTVSLDPGAANTVIVGGGGTGRRGYNPGNNCWDGNAVGQVGCPGNSGTGSQLRSTTVGGGGGGGGKNGNGAVGGGGTAASGSGGGGGSGDNSFVGIGGGGATSGGNGSGGRMGGGGGGASANGSVALNLDYVGSGDGGSGATSSLSGSPVMYGSGGSGGTWGCNYCIVAAPSGAGMGGYSGVSGGFAVANTGGGGGGGGGDGTWGGFGGSGVVILQYSTVPGAPTSVTATAGQQQVTVSWVAPTFTGGTSITGYSVVSSPAGATCTPSPATATTCTATGLTAGTSYTFTVTPSNANGSGTAATSNAATPFGALAKFAVTTTGGAALSTQVAGTPFNVRITAQDSAGTTVTSFTGTVDLTSTSLFGSSTGGTTAAFTAGVLASTSITLTRAGGSQTITATQTGAAIGGSSAAFTINAGSATQLQALLPGETADPGTVSGKTGSPTPQAAGASFTTTVNAVDANWNVVTSATPTVHLTSSDGSATLPANAALVSGTKAFTVTLNTMGSQTITASDTAGSSPLTSSTSAAVSVGKPAQATLTVTSTNGVYGSALTLTTSGGSGTGDVTYSAVPGTALGCTVSGSAPDTLSVTQAGTCLVTATKAEDANYAQAVSAQTTVTFAKAQQAAFSITSASTVVFGESVTLTTAGGSGTGAISFSPGSTTGTASCAVSTGSTNSVTGTAAGGTCEVIGEKADDDNYLQVLTSQRVTVTTRPITVTASSPSIQFGAAVAPSVSVTSGTLAFSNAISGATYTYTGTGSTSYGPVTTPPSAVGTYSVMPSVATFSNGSAANYSILYEAGTLTISQAAQTISFAQPSGVTYGAAPYALAPTASSGLAVTLTSSTPLVCTVASNIVTITGAGTCTLTASQEGNANYSPAPNVSHSFAVAQASQATLTMSSAATVPYGRTIALGTSGGSGTGAVTYAVSGSSTCTVSGSTLTLGDAGSTCEVTATKAGDTNYTLISSAAQTVTITQAGQVVSFTSAVPSSVEFGDTYTPAATVLSTVTAVDSGVTASFAVSGNCTLAGGVVTFGLPGTCTVTASALGNTNFTAAPNATQVISIGSTNQSITFAQPSNVSFGSSSVSMGATASSNGDVTYALGVGTTNSACSVSTLGVVTILAVGTCEVTASAAAYDQYAAASDVTRAFQVLPALATAPTITSASAANQAMTVGFTAPGFAGGVAITAYQLVATPTGAGATVTSNACSTSPCTITGLANGTAYTVTVAAINAAGVGPASGASTSLTAATSANSVGGLYAIPGNNQVTLNWTPLTVAQAGGGVFDKYEVYVFNAGTSLWDLLPTSLNSQSDSTVTITGLSNGDSHRFKVVAVTDINGTPTVGNSTEVSEYASTTASAPRTLTVLAATATDVQVSWQVPLSDGGAALIAPYYSVTITSTTSNATTPITCTFAVATDTFCASAAQLTNDAVYSITVAAINRMGSGTVASTTYAVPSSTDTLSDLQVNAGAVSLSPAFASGTNAYTVTVPFSVPSVAITPTATSGSATVTVDGAAVVSGTASSAIALPVGVTVIDVVVTASDPRYSRTYTVTVTRLPAPVIGLPTDGLPVPGRVVPVPSVLTGGSDTVAVLVDGVLQPRPTMTTNPSSSGWVITGSDYSLSVSARNGSGQPYPVNARGVMQVPQGGSLALAGSGTAPSTEVAVFAVPLTSSRIGYRSSEDATYLGTLTADAGGSFNGVLTVPSTVPLGSYALQVNTVTPANQVRSVNVLLDVVAAVSSGMTGQLREAAFYKGQSDRFTRAGKEKLRALVRALPAEAEDVVVNVVGVAESLPTRSANIRLARERAEAIADYLESAGVKGRYVVTISTAYVLRDAGSIDRTLDVQRPMVSSKGKPLTTASITYSAPT